jgi:putative copper export protein
LTDLLRFLHILAAAVWLGATLWVAGDVRRTLAAGRGDAGALGARVSPALSLDLAAGILVLVTGLLVLLVQRVHPRTGIMVGFALTLIRLGVVAAGLRPAWRAIAKRLQAGETVPPTDAPVKKMAMFSGIAHTLWLIALATMVFPV